VTWRWPCPRVRRWPPRAPPECGRQLQGYYGSAFPAIRIAQGPSEASARRRQRIKAGGNEDASTHRAARVRQQLISLKSGCRRMARSTLVRCTSDVKFADPRRHVKRVGGLCQRAHGILLQVPETFSFKA